MRCADASTLALVAEQTIAHDDFVRSVGFSPDGTRIVSGSDDFRVKVWGARRLLAQCYRVLVVEADVQWAAAEAVCVGVM